MTVCVKVHILDVPYHADCEYDYYASSHIAEEINVGSLVIVPFGAANRQKVALVTGYGEKVEYETNRIKHIISSMSSCLSLTEEMMALCRFMKSTTLCTIGDAVKCIVPTMLVSKVEELLYPTDKEYRGEEHKEVYEYICAKPGVTLGKLSDKISLARDLVSGEETVINLPKSNVLELILGERGSVIARPSGTEPKVKFYYTAVGETKEAAKTLLDAMVAQMSK